MTAGLGWYRRLYERVLRWSASNHGMWAIGLFSFAEASFFPIPPDVLIITATLADPKVWLRAAGVCSIASVAGGLFGYLIGWGVWELVADTFYSLVPGFSAENYDKVSGLYQRWDFWIVFAAGFTPLPFKVFTIAAGVSKISLPMFLLASTISRSARFFLVAGLLRFFGPKIKPFLDRYLPWLSILFFLLLIGGFFAIKLLLH